MTESFRLVETGLDPALLALSPDENAYRVRDRLTDAEYEILAGHLAARPDAWLWLEDRCTNLEVLRLFPGLRNLNVTSLRLASWDGIRHVADSLEQLVIGETTLKGMISIAPIGSATSLRSLHLYGPARHADAIERLTELEDLTLRSVTLPDLELLKPMRRLTTLRILLGGTSDLRALPALERLEELELWRIRGLRDVSVVGSIPALRVLRLQAMSAVARLPSLRAATSLRILALDAMKGITDLSPVAEAPALEELFLVDMRQLDPSALRPLLGHPTLRHGVWGLGSRRKNAEAWKILPLGEAP